VARTAGFTLWELLWTLTIAGVVLALAIPSFQEFLLDSKRTTDINALVLAIQMARSEAAKRGSPVVVCKSIDRFRCRGNEIRFDAGWMVFVNEDDVRPPHRSPGEPLLYAHVPKLAGTITANRALFEFRPFRQRSTNGTVTFCDQRAEGAARAVIVSYTGRPRVDSVGPGGERLPCARLP
jgi:type IV fimbrial biogenesis protein FimT